MRRGLKRTTGFTIIEIFYGVSLMGLLVVLAMWRMGPALERAKIRRVASVMAGDLQYAQLMAARVRQPVVFIVVPASQAYLIRNRVDSTAIYRQRFVGSDTDYSADALTASPSNSVEIFPNGVVTQTTTFSITIDTVVRQVRISSAGQIRVLRP